MSLRYEPSSEHPAVEPPSRSPSSVCSEWSAVERIQHKQASQGHILALPEEGHILALASAIFSAKVCTPIYVIPSLLASAPPTPHPDKGSAPPPRKALCTSIQSQV